MPTIWIILNLSWMNCEKIPEIIQVSASANVPGDKITNWGFGAEGVEKSFSLNVNITDETYAETMGLEMVEGRYFSKDFRADTAKIVLNETAVELLELENPIGHITLYVERQGHTLRGDRSGEGLSLGVETYGGQAPRPDAPGDRGKGTFLPQCEDCR